MQLFEEDMHTQSGFLNHELLVAICELVKKRELRVGFHELRVGRNTQLATHTFHAQLTLFMHNSHFLCTTHTFHAQLSLFKCNSHFLCLTHTNAQIVRCSHVILVGSFVFINDNVKLFLSKHSKAEICTHVFNDVMPVPLPRPHFSPAPAFTF